MPEARLTLHFLKDGRLCLFLAAPEHNVPLAGEVNITAASNEGKPTGSVCRYPAVPIGFDHSPVVDKILIEDLLRKKCPNAKLTQ